MYVARYERCSLLLSITLTTVYFSDEDLETMRKKMKYNKMDNTINASIDNETALSLIAFSKPINVHLLYILSFRFWKNNIKYNGAYDITNNNI
jgi:hypothetical protein